MRKRGFTITELLVVILIISILAGLLMPVIYDAHRASLRVACTNNLQQIHKGLQVYRDEQIYRGRELNPPRITFLISRYVPNPDCFVCPADTSEGTEGGKPDMIGVDQYDELDEPVADPRGQVDGTHPCSYMYEFSMAAPAFEDWKGYVTLPPRAWGVEDEFVDLDGDPSWSSWGEVKTAQMRYGDTFLNTDMDPKTWHGYSPTRSPVLRCFWHAENPNTHEVNDILNLSYSGNVFPSEAHWETASRVW